MDDDTGSGSGIALDPLTVVLDGLADMLPRPTKGCFQIDSTVRSTMTTVARRNPTATPTLTPSVTPMATATPTEAPSATAAPTRTATQEGRQCDDSGCWYDPPPQEELDDAMAAIAEMTDEAAGESDAVEYAECDPAYPDFCIPPVWLVGDLDCVGIDGAYFTVYDPDPHGLDVFEPARISHDILAGIAHRAI